LGTSRHNTVVDVPIQEVKARAEGLLLHGDAMKLRVMRTHDRAIVANELFTRVAKEPQWLVVQETLFFHDWIHLIHVRVRIPTLPICVTSLHLLRTSVKRLRTTTEVRRLVRVCRRHRRGFLAGRWFRILRLLSYLHTLLTLGIFISGLGSYTNKIFD
jgi:hypothetical protein